MLPISKIVFPVIVAAALALGACSTPKPAEAPRQAPPPAAPAQVSTAIVPGSIKDFQANVGDTVHFDFNEYAIRDSD